MRPGCDRPAAARLTYDTVAAAVWLDRPTDDGEPAQQVCSVHAATLTAPLGWTVTDRRLLGVGTPRPMPHPSLLGTDTAATSADDASGTTTPGEVHPEPEGEPTPAEVGVADSGLRDTESDPTRPEDTEPAGTRSEESAAELNGSEEPEPEPAEPAGPPGHRKGSGSKRKGKLLDRAFEWTGPQHSVLTTGPDSRRRSD